jgi:hypothetical protein
VRPIRLPPWLHGANEALAFLLELVMLGALGVWGAKTGSSRSASIALGAGAPLAAAVAWGLFAAPKARVRLPMAGVLAVKALAFGSGAGAMAALGWHVTAIAFGVTAMANAVVAAFDRDAAKTASVAP